MSDERAIDLDGIVQVVRQVLSERRGIRADSIEADTRLEDLGLDSLDIAEVFLNLEEAVGYRLDPDSVPDVDRVEDLTRLRPLASGAGAG
jgi:acyl carrier protein